MSSFDPLRFHEPHIHLDSAFGGDKFGQRAEAFARFFGTPKFLIGQTVLVVIWIAFNAVGAALAWDPYPFILLNLAFSTQAAYAAPLILLAQTRQAARDQAHAEAGAKHLERISQQELKLLEENTRLTEQIHRLSTEIHARINAPAG